MIQMISAVFGLLLIATSMAQIVSGQIFNGQTNGVLIFSILFFFAGLSMIVYDLSTSRTLSKSLLSESGYALVFLLIATILVSGGFVYANYEQYQYKSGRDQAAREAEVKQAVVLKKHQFRQKFGRNLVLLLEVESQKSQWFSIPIGEFRKISENDMVPVYILISGNGFIPAKLSLENHLFFVSFLFFYMLLFIVYLSGLRNYLLRAGSGHSVQK